MTDSGDGVTFVSSEVVKAVLAENKNGVNLHTALQVAGLSYLSPIALGGSKEEVISELPSTGAEWMATFDEAWSKAADSIMPNMVLKRAEVWAGVSLPRAEAPPSSGGGATGGERASTAAVSATLEPGYSGGNDVWIDEMMAGLKVSPHDVSKAMVDIKAQGLSGVRIMALSLALMSGRVQPAGESKDLLFGSDLRLCPLVRAQRKAGVESLDDIIKSGSKRKVAQHFTRLAKDYNEHGMIQEATLVSQFWTESTGAFEGDDPGLLAYLGEWNRSYAGRGIPKLLDTELILRSLRSKGGSGESSSEMKELKDKLKASQDKLSAADQRAADLLKRVSKIETTMKNPSNPTSKDGGGGRDMLRLRGESPRAQLPEQGEGQGQDEAG